MDTLLYCIFRLCVQKPQSLSLFRNFYTISKKFKPLCVGEYLNSLVHSMFFSICVSVGVDMYVFNLTTILFVKLSKMSFFVLYNPLLLKSLTTKK